MHSNPANNGHREGNIFAAPFFKATLSTGGPSDLWVVFASTSPITRVELLSVSLSFSSSAVSSNPQALGVEIYRGSTGGSGGSAISPVNLRGWSGVPTAGSSVSGPSTTIASTASATRIWCDVAYASIGWTFPPTQELTGLVRPVIASGQRLHVRIDTPQAALVASGSLVFRELGAGVPS